MAEGSEPCDESRLYVTWRHPTGRMHPVGLLTRRASAGDETYRFVYLKQTEGLDGFSALPGLPDLHRVYQSPVLFALFRNRLMSPRRPDYPDYLRMLDLDVDSDSFAVMARNEGRKLTDQIEVFSPPLRTPADELTTLFFARGVRWREGAAAAITGLRTGDRLRLVDDPGNDVNPRALQLDTVGGDPVGWVADYLVDTVHDLRDLAGKSSVIVSVEHVNPPEVAPRMRLICRLTAPWPMGYEPLSGPEFQPIVA